MTPLSAFARIAALAVLVAIAGCSAGGGLSPGLTARMDQNGAQLNRGEALGIINHYRATVGAGALSEDPALSAQAASLAASYAKTGRQPAKPAGVVEVRYSAGYATFADTFSGWRNSGQNSSVMSDKAVTRAGIAVVYEENSPYGVYWVVIVA